MTTQEDGSYSITGIRRVVTNFSMESRLQNAFFRYVNSQLMDIQNLVVLTLHYEPIEAGEFSVLGR